jgi:hypothetical protein
MRAGSVLLFIFLLIGSITAIINIRDIASDIKVIKNTSYNKKSTPCSCPDTVYIHDTIYTRAWTCFPKR